MPAALEDESDRIRLSLRAFTDAERRLSVSQAEEGTVHGPAADVASDLPEAEFALGLEEATRVRLGEVEAALRRITNHHYGVGERCDNLIPIARLHALPWTATCVTCASLPALRAVP